MRTVAELAETLADLDLFIEICQYLDKNPCSSYKDIVAHVGKGLTHQKISEFLTRIEKQFGALVVERKHRSKNNTLTDYGKSAYERAKSMRDYLLDWPARENQMLRVGVPNLIIHSLLPSILPPFRKNLASRNIEADIRVTDEYDIDVLINKVIKRDLDVAIIWRHEGNDHYKNNIKQSFNGKAVLEDDFFGVSFEMLMICPPEHEFVDDARNFKSPSGTPWKLDLDQLSGKLMYLLPAQRQPLYKLLPPPTEPHLQRVEMNHYIDILSQISCHVREGVGLVPSVFPDLNEMRRKGMLFYSRVMSNHASGDALRVRLGCITRKGIENLDDLSKEFLARAKSCFNEVSRFEYDFKYLEALPAKLGDYTAYKHCCFVMQQDKTFGVPEWYRGDLNWRTTSRDGKEQLTGTFTAYTKRSYVFDIKYGKLLTKPGDQNPLFQFVADGTSKGQINTISCTFNMSSRTDQMDYDAIIGFWDGNDDQGFATRGPMVLSQSRLDVETVRLLVNKVDIRCLQNAVTEGKTGVN